MPRLLRLALLVLLFAITAGKGVVAAQMAACESPMPAHAGMRHDGIETRHCHTPAGTADHAYGPCCPACVNGSLSPLQAPAVLDRPARRVALSTLDERYRSLLPTPPHRPPRTTA
jgi:hypothetical protein